MSKRLTLALALAAATVAIPAVTVGRGAAQPTLGVWMHCVSDGNGGLECNASPSGGVAPYTYNWAPDPISPWTEDSYTFVPCQFPHHHPVTQQYGAWVTLTVTDSYGATWSSRRFFGCGPAA
jgi:hypothetical protein